MSGSFPLTIGIMSLSLLLEQNYLNVFYFAHKLAYYVVPPIILLNMIIVWTLIIIVKCCLISCKELDQFWIFALAKHYLLLPIPLKALALHPSFN